MKEGGKVQPLTEIWYFFWKRHLRDIHSSRPDLKTDNEHEFLLAIFNFYNKKKASLAACFFGNWGLFINGIIYQGWGGGH